ncbi:3-isopropylmalate dehydratase large subunit [Variovorax sp. LjRoot178]|uniref:3-isopropylmalate dehydratase large subunit n=1 Tax=Variovorax sp. LjRoot178 TaxID=3342277 RepID=UPI003ED09EF2
MATVARTLVDKLLDASTIHEEGGRSLLYVDRVIAADTATPAFHIVASSGHTVRRPRQAILIPDHYTPSTALTLDHAADDDIRMLIAGTQATAKAFGVRVLGLEDPRRGIQHLVAGEQAYAQPGLVVAAADSHTSTQGALGALPFSVGIDLAHVLATQCVWVHRPRMMRILLKGSLAPNVTAKDVILHVIARLGPAGASGFAVEYAGGFVRNLPISGRITLCNMAVEMGARTTIIAPDDATFEYLQGRPLAPAGAMWEQAVAHWRTLRSDAGAIFERELSLDVSCVEPMVTWGNNTAAAVPIGAAVPDPLEEPDPERREQMQAWIDYMGLQPLAPLVGLAVDQVFIGSCANGTLDDLRDAARFLRGRKVAVRTLVVAGSGLVKAQAEREGLAKVFVDAGATWGESGCSMCSAMNGDALAPGVRCVSTANRNHYGRQGPGSRTHLASPAMAAAAAVAGCLVDVRGLGVA